MRLSVQPTWCLELPLQQQSVLLMGARGPDGIPKTHPCKDVQRAYRATVLVAARYGRCLRLGERADGFMALNHFRDTWPETIGRYYESIDQLPIHFVMHLLHGAQILGYKHPEQAFRQRWLEFYLLGCSEMHLYLESEMEMDDRLGDWHRRHWDAP